MAVITLAARSDVGRVLTRGNRAVVAGITRAQHLGVIDRVGRCPQRIVVAIFTNIGGLDVRRILAGCTVAVVAGDTASNNIDVIEVRR